MPVARLGPSVADRGIDASSPYGTAPPIVNEVVRTPGKALDTLDREMMGSRLHHDFSKVRVHADARAATSAKAIDAQAYTVGSHIVFDDGKYAPRSSQGQQLLAHELIHTLQQSHGVLGTGALALGDPDDHSEAQAHRIAAAGLAEEPATTSNRSIRVQRQPNQSAPKPAPDLAESASPFLAGAIGSVTIDGFETGKSDISQSNQSTLAKTARTIQTLLKKYPGSTIRVIGHTDAVGTDESNQSLGEARAHSVQTALVDLGIPFETIIAESKGESQLLVKSVRAEARNRRVEVRFQPHTTPSFGLNTDKYSTTPQPPLSSGSKVNVTAPIGVSLPPTIEGVAPGATTPPAPSAPATKETPPAVGEIKVLTELIKKTADGAKRDPLVRQLRDKIATLQPFIPAADFKQAVDKAIDALVKQGTESGIMAILEAVTGRSPTPVPDKRDQTGPLMRERPLPPIIKGPSLPIDDAPKPAPRFSYQYRDGVRNSYAPGAPIKFTLMPPDKPMDGGKRLVIVASDDRDQPNPTRLGEVSLESDKPTPIEMTAPTTPGKYVIRVNIGLSYDYSSVQEFEVTSANKK